MHYEKFMRQALKEALKAARKEEIPVGAVAIFKGKIIARGHNKKETQKNPLHHAELLCIDKAAKKLGSWRLKDVTLISTLEPCPMCAGAIIHARIPHLVYGTDDPKTGAAGSIMNILNHKKLNHRVKVTKGVLKKDCQEMLKRFFKKLRD